MTSIFVAKLDFNTTDAELKALFEQYGKVNRVTIAKDRETGNPRGFAFVEMFNEQEAEAAIDALDNVPVHGRPIAVKKADDRGAKPAGGNQGGGNFQRGERPKFDRNERTERPPRQEGQSDFRSNDFPPRREEGSGFTPPLDAPLKTERKKEPKSGTKKSFSEQPKQHKMEAYRKSGKDNQFLDDDDLVDEELDLFGRNEEDEDDEDYRKYLVNSDEDEDYDDWKANRRDTGWDEEE